MKRVRLSRAKNFARAAAAAVFVAALSFGAPASQSADPSDILARAAEKGRQAAEALRKYTYYAELTLEIISPAETVTGKYYRFSKISHDGNGVEQEKIFEATTTLPPEMHITTNSVNNLLRVYRFMITPETMKQYEFTYVGRETIDELSTYAFDVKPKVKLPDPDKSAERYLKGRVWIDDQDFLVVKASGVALPEQRAHRTPKFETYFQNHDSFWFPAFVKADDDVRAGRRLTRVIITVRFTSYERPRG